MVTNPTDSYPEAVIFHLEFSSKIKKKETKKERKNSSFLEARYFELKNKPVCAILLTTRCCFAKCALNICAHICTTAIPTTPIYYLLHSVKHKVVWMADPKEAKEDFL